jgi:D-glycero-alpha-D-manno-heptose 1-phosphate guanylyltransferase
MGIEPGSVDVLILAGGLGTRLKPVISDRPKPLAPIAGRPFISYLLDLLSFYGFRSATLCTGYQAEKFDDLIFTADIEIRISRENKPLGTAGALAHAVRRSGSGNAENLSDPILVLNGDSITDGDLRQFLQWYGQGAADNAIAGVEMDDISRYGSIVADDDGRIQSFGEKSRERRRGLVNAGVYLLRLATIEGLPEGQKISLEHDLFPAMAGNRTNGLYIWKGCTRLIDIGTPKSYENAGKVVDGFRRN